MSVFAMARKTAKKATAMNSTIPTTKPASEKSHHPKNTSSTESPKGLLKVPAELRLKIYEYYLRSSAEIDLWEFLKSIKVAVSDFAKLDQLNEACKKETPRCGNIRKVEQPALARVSRIFRYEMLPMWIQKSFLRCDVEVPFVIFDSWTKKQKDDLFGWLDKMGETLLGNLTEVRFGIVFSSRDWPGRSSIYANLFFAAGKLHARFTYDCSKLEAVVRRMFRELVKTSNYARNGHWNGMLLVDFIRQVHTENTRARLRSAYVNHELPTGQGYYELEMEATPKRVGDFKKGLWVSGKPQTIWWECGRPCH
ncbi:hypothetical protein NA57DRAFT_55715 [Rhizodiscina lignyota]|uniref:Uncharacterized protein n=1 Tax=Rhizodiscina lignyota TaxID=1504668 RepID=A0A9P4II78_9PEZI|nr:hypothetical protein NA57DRAFT_55715 [Rhizodiscina lignyota]